MKIIVVGAGVIGCAFALRAAQAGFQTVVIEAGRPGHGASIGSFAWLNAHDKRPRAYHDLTVRALAAHRRLGDEFGDAPWRHEGGAIEWVADDAAIAAQRDRVARLRDWGSTVDWIDIKELHELEPDIAPEAVNGAPIAFYPDDGWVDPVVFAHIHLRRAIDAGATFRRGCIVARLLRAANRVHGVALANGENVEADLVVLCAGAATNELLPAELHIPLSPKRGLTAITQPAPAHVRRVIRSAQCYLRPDGAGRLMLHGKAADATLTETTIASTDLPAVADLLDRAGVVLPGVRGIAPESARIVTRPYPEDGFPAVGSAPALDGLYLAVMHSGVILAPLMAELMAADIRDSDGCSDLASYRPGRFHAARESPAPTSL